MLERQGEELNRQRVSLKQLIGFFENEHSQLYKRDFAFQHLSDKFLLEISLEEVYLIPDEFFAPVVRLLKDDLLREERTELVPY